MPYEIQAELNAWYVASEPIIRCRDCRHYHADINGCDEFGDIWHDEYENVEPDGFCAWGKKVVDE